MSTTKHLRGSCACGRVTFEVDVDLAAGTTRCNCTKCWKRRWWGVIVKPAAFQALTGVDELVKWRAHQGPGGFCRHCGIVPFVSGDAADWNDGDYVSVNVACLELDHEELAQVPIAYLDGLHDTWAKLEPPPRHL